MMLAQAELSKVVQCLIVSNYCAYVRNLREFKARSYFWEKRLKGNLPSERGEKWSSSTRSYLRQSCIRDSWESTLKQASTFLPCLGTILIVIIWVTSHQFSQPATEQYLLVILKAKISNKALWTGTGSMKREKRRVSCHLSGEKLPSLLHYPKYNNVANLDQMLKLFVGGAQANRALVSDWIFKSSTGLHCRERTQQQGSALPPEATLHGKGPWMGPGVVKKYGYVSEMLWV